jgi:hypothetical protein
MVLVVVFRMVVTMPVLLSRLVVLVLSMVVLLPLRLAVLLVRGLPIAGTSGARPSAKSKKGFYSLLSLATLYRGS